MHYINLVVGDWSKDGHNQMDKFLVESNVSIDYLRESYQLGCEIISFDPINRACSDYEDHKISAHMVGVFKEVGFEFESINEDGSASTYSDEWANMILFICKLGNPNIVVERLTGKDWHIGGYGLYY